MKLLGLTLALVLAVSGPALAQGPSPGPTPDAVIAAHPGFSGVVLVAKDGKPVFEQAYGLANRELGVPNALATKFRIGSITKQFTAVAILQLAEAGKLSIDDPVSKFYSAAPDSWKAVTIKHLLTHTSGIPSYTGLPTFFAKLSREDRTPEQVIELTRDMPLSFEPGARYAYNNTGYVILGHVVEKASGRPYAEYIEQNIFKPLGMTSSGYDNSRRVIANRAAGYELENGEVVNAAFLAMSLPYAAGSLYSTAGDLLIWDQALKSGKLLSPASYQAMYTDYGHGYGYGWQVGKMSGHDRINHGGGINGFVTQLDRYPNDGLTVIVLSNLTSARPAMLADGLGATYLGVPPRQAIADEALVRSAIEGLRRGEPNYDRMSPGLAATTRAQLPIIRQSLDRLGALKSVTLLSAEVTGMDRFKVVFENGAWEYSLRVAADGTIATAGMGPMVNTAP